MALGDTPNQRWGPGDLSNVHACTFCLFWLLLRAPAPTSTSCLRRHAWISTLIRNKLWTNDVPWAGYQNPCPISPTSSPHRTVHSAHPGLYHQVQLRAISTCLIRNWLHVLPITACGQRNNKSFLISLHLDVNICEKHLCPCSAQFLKDGSHPYITSLAP